MKYKNLAKLMLFSLVFLLITIAFVSAKKYVFDIAIQANDVGYKDFTGYNNFSVSLLGVEIVDNSFYETETGYHLFTVQVLDKNKNLIKEKQAYANFVVFGATETLNRTSIITSFEYSENIVYIKVYYQSTLLLEKDIFRTLCNNNGKCDGSENYLYCQDCEWYDNDSLCLGAGEVFNLIRNNLIVNYWEDHYCDLDCYKDDDCGKENCNDNIKNQNEEGVDCGGVCLDKCKNIFQILTGQATKNIEKIKNSLIIILIIIVLIIAILIYKKEARRR